MKNKEVLKRLAQIELARNDFWYFCRLVCPSFYKPNRKYLKELCYTFQRFYESEEDNIMIISIAPRHGKTLTCKLFCRWVLSKNHEEKIMSASYNSTLSTLTSKEIRDAIDEEKIDEDKIVNSDIFPGTKIKRGSKSAKMWKVEGASTVSFLATAPKSTATGFGCTLLCIDDIIKNAEEAYNEALLDKIWSWYTDTMVSRVESGGRRLFISTRWCDGDLSGRVLEFCRRTGQKVLHVNFRLEQPDGTLLEGSPLSLEDVKQLKALMSEDIFSANYNQEPLDAKDRMYEKICTYKKKDENVIFYSDYEKEVCVRELPINFDTIRAYVDTSDKGEDYTCCVIAGVDSSNNDIYLLDVVYTQLPMQRSVGIVAERLNKWQVAWCDVEANNGGEGYGIELSRILSQTLNNNYTHIHTFTQTHNKEARIRSMSAAIQRLVFFPYDYLTSENMREFGMAISRYKNIGKNQHDDAPDALTGLIEKLIENGYIRWIK